MLDTPLAKVRAFSSDKYVNESIYAAMYGCMFVMRCAITEEIIVCVGGKSSPSMEAASHGPHH